MTKVSVIIPVYNTNKYLRQCLDSVVNQSLEDIEIICIDDGSIDNSLDILREYEQQDKRIKVISKPNSGYGASMNIGLKTAKGEYIGIVESDDFAEKDMFRILYNIAKEKNLDVIRCQYFLYRGDLNKNTVFDNSWVPQNKVYCPLEIKTPLYQAPAIWCNLVKNNLIKKYNISFLETPGASYQDTSFAFKVYSVASRFMMISNPLIHYRTDNESSSVNSSAKAFYVNKEYQEIIRFSKEIKIYDAVRRMIPKLKYGCYRWNHERLKPSIKPLFILSWGFECLKDFLLKNIDKKEFTKKEYKRIKTLAFFPIIYLFRKAL